MTNEYDELIKALQCEAFDNCTNKCKSCLLENNYPSFRLKNDALTTAADAITALLTRAELAEKQLDAAVEDITNCCDTCGKSIQMDGCFNEVNGDCANWQWKGKVKS